MNRLIENEMEVTVEKAKRIYGNVDVVEDRKGDLVSISGDGNYEYFPYYNEVRLIFPDNKFVVLLAKNFQAKIIEYAEEERSTHGDEIETPDHYDNSTGTLYKVAEERGWNSYVFDAVKRLERAEKKGEFESDIDKTIVVLELYKKEKK